MPDSESNYKAILIDTSIYDGNGLRLEKGLLGKLHQFKLSPIEFLMPDVIKNEIKNHLEQKIKIARAALEKSLNDAGDHLFFEGSELNEAKRMLIEGKEITGLAESRIENFIENSGALILDSGMYVSVTDLLGKYFSNSAPFADFGKKKYEFPDAIVLMAVEAWAAENDISVLAVAKDNDWKEYCENSLRIDYEEDLSAALARFNNTNAPYMLVANLTKSLKEGTASDFLNEVRTGLANVLDGITPDQDADSYLYWEGEGSNGWLHDFELLDNEFRIVEHDAEYVVLETKAIITVEVEGDFSLSIYDSIDRNYMSMAGVTVTTFAKFESEILITVTGDLSDLENGITVEEVEVLDLIDSVHFGTLEPEYDEDCST